jgi:hypothetical protein
VPRPRGRCTSVGAVDMNDAESTRAADAADGESDQTAAIADTSKTAPAELAWSAATEEQETEAISEKRSRALWLGPVMALLAAAIAVASVVLFYVLRAPAPKAPAPPPPSASARPAPPSPSAPPPPTSTTPPTTTTTTTTTSAVASGPAIGRPCSDWSKIARDLNTGLTIICDGATGAGAAPPHWMTDDFSHLIGVQTIGTSCAGFKSYAMAISPDDYLVTCFPADVNAGQLAGPGSTWQIYHP